MSKSNDESAIVNMEVQPGEQVSRSRNIDVAAETVRLYNVSKNDKTGKNYKVNWTFDFSGVTDEQMLELASRSAVIAYRKHFRNVPEDRIPEYAERTIDVLEDVLTQERRGLSASEKAARLVAKMTDAEKAELLASLGIESNE